jgi:hypothetical protein
MRPALPAAPALLLLAAAAFAAAEPFAYARWFEPAGRGSGLWGGKFLASATDKELDGLVLVADWWEGPGDLRAGDDAKSVLKNVVFEVKRGDGAWVALPAAERDLRLRARAEAPVDAKALRGGSPGGEWSVRQSAGGEYARHVRVEFTLKGDPLLVTDLAVDELRLPGLDAPPKVGRPHLPDRQDTPRLDPDQAFTAVAVVRNAGARKTKECDLDLFAAPWGARKGAKRLAFAAIPALAPGGSAEVKVEGRIPADATVNGPWEIWVVADPRAALRETESLNNVLGRGVTLVVPPPKEANPLDDR